MTQFETKILFTALRLTFAQQGLTLMSLFSQLQSPDLFLVRIKEGSIHEVYHIIDETVWWRKTKEGEHVWLNIHKNFSKRLHNLVQYYNI